MISGAPSHLLYLSLKRGLLALIFLHLTPDGILLERLYHIADPLATCSSYSEARLVLAGSYRW